MHMKLRKERVGRVLRRGISYRRILANLILFLVGGKSFEPPRDQMSKLELFVARCMEKDEKVRSQGIAGSAWMCPDLTSVLSGAFFLCFCIPAL